MTSAGDLFALQDIDLRRDARRAVIADIDSRLGETEELVAAREALTTAQADVERLRREQRELDDQLKDLDAKVQPLEAKLYDGSVRNAKELTAMQHEVEQMRERRGTLDDAGLSLIETIEAANNELSRRQGDLRLTEQAWKADQQELRDNRERAERETATLEAERGRWTDSMDKSSLGLYESLRLKKQGRAVARVERNNCSGCRLTIPTHIVQRVRAGGLLVQCPSCERILVGN